MATSIPYGAAQAVQLQSIALYTVTQQRLTTLNRLAGKFPTQASTEARLRVQTSSDYPVVRCRDLTKKAGDEITFDLINPINGKPIMGSQYAEGHGEAMTFSQDRLRINQTRKPISAGDTMTQQRTPHDLRKLGRAQGEGYMAKLEDQLTLVHLAGARGFQDNIEWVVPLASDADFASICINSVKAPTNNRHFMSTGAGIETVKAGSSAITIATTDVANLDMIDAIRAHIDGMALPPAPIIFDGDKMGADSPIRVLMVSPLQYNSIIQSGNFRTLQATAMARASQAGNNPLFMGEAGLWNGILIVKMPKAIRFYAGDEIRWCASATSETETTGDLVPSSFSTTHAVDRALLLGAQALADAQGKHRKSGVPYFWSEKELDHGDKLEMLVGMINGKSKIRFEVDHGSSMQPTDNGVVAIDTAVQLTGL